MGWTGKPISNHWQTRDSGPTHDTTLTILHPRGVWRETVLCCPLVSNETRTWSRNLNEFYLQEPYFTVQRMPWKCCCFDDTDVMRQLTQWQTHFNLVKWFQVMPQKELTANHCLEHKSVVIVEDFKHIYSWALNTVGQTVLTGGNKSYRSSVIISQTVKNHLIHQV